MPIIAPGVVRYAIEGRQGGQEIVNIVDVNISDVLGGSRDEAIETVAGDLLNQWSDHILPLLSNVYSAEAVSWIDLDSADGGTGSVSSTDGSSWPEPGGSAGAPMPNNVTMRVRKVINGARGRRSGSMRLAGTLEAWTGDAGPNLWQTNVLATFATAFEALRDGINGSEGGGSVDYTANIVVVHTVDDAYVADSNVTSFQPLPQIGTQRRRMPGYGS